ncbi:serine/threonine-protein kinase [Chloropicon primus]|uniref:Serine/threonine-protein kinase n=1 Tax=Chloropicon primus TaxID=1764295 RepID=A0A5B8MQW2_9CHLO|nr:serine/threonine-protein kinase [Chloropicon primus]|eukprot:QDZ22005.1 serine/threonine-protein kinase [Chloropicon primus]
MGACLGRGAGSFKEVGEMGLPSERFTVLKKLGSGAEGELYLMKDKTRDKGDQLVALKMILRGSLVDEVRMLREITLQSTLNHIHVIKLYQILLTDSHFCILMEYAPGGDLFKYITKKVKPVSKYQAMSEEEARYVFKQVLSAVDYCHKRHIAHRDLKLANILLDDSWPPRVKICDFGLSRSYDYEHENCYTIVGTPAYMSPEVLDPKHNPDGYDPVKADIWSAGVILYAMLRGRFPFDTHEGNLKAVLRNIKAAHQGDPQHLWAPAWGNAKLSDEVKDLLDRMLDLDAERRINISEILEHPWMSKDLSPSDTFTKAQMFAEEAQEKWNKVSDVMDQTKQDRLRKLVHEALIEHGHPGEILEWHPPTSLRVRTAFSHANLSSLLDHHEENSV